MTKKVARDIMTSDVLIAEGDWTTDRLAKFFIEHGISGAPVLGAAGEVLGVVSQSDLRAKDASMTASQLMTPVVFSVEEDAPISEIAGTMIQGQIHRVLVLQGGKVSGIISTFDLLGLLTGD